MKDLKHYFSTPSASKNADNSDSDKKKKKRKRRITDDEVVTNKKKKDIETPKISLKSDKKPNTDSSKENSFEDDTNLNESTNSLFNYFSKVDKIPPMAPKDNKIVVQAVVHSPPEERRSELKTRLRVRREFGKEPEYDIITNENPVDKKSLFEVLDDDLATEVRKEVKPKSNSIASFFTGANAQREAAVKQFLHSRIDIKPIKQKEVIEGIPAPYPKITHVRQKDNMNIIWSLPQVNLNTPETDTNPKSPEWSCITDRNSYPKEETEIKKINQKQALKALKTQYKDYPITTWYKEILKQNKNSQHDMWTEKYKPDCLNNILGNKNDLIRFKTWLESFKENAKVKDQEDSEDDFLNSDDESSKVFKNIAVITGPVGTGKTTSVYAISQELGYEVLELNASCNRNGKKIHKDFSEALQSHNANAICLTPKKKKIDKKRSLILIEDADLLFNDCDEGYSQTVVSLASSSKRPIVFVANDSDMKYLNKLKPHFEMELKFKHVDTSLLTAWLKAICIAENRRYEETPYRTDVRRCLLQLQFFQTKFHSNKLNDTWNIIGKCNLSCSNLIKETARFTTLLSTNDILCSNDEDPVPSIRQNILKNSTSLIHIEDNRSCLTDEIASCTSELLHRLAAPDENYITQKTEVIDVINSTAQELIPPSSILSKGTVCTDYMACLRQMARYEKDRLQNQTKRTSRFNNYLYFLGLEKTSGASLDVMCKGLIPETNFRKINLEIRQPRFFGLMCHTHTTFIIQYLVKIKSKISLVEAKNLLARNFLYPVF